jgi:iron complex transport system substrate-binding protein
LLGRKFRGRSDRTILSTEGSTAKGSGPPFAFRDATAAGASLGPRCARRSVTRVGGYRWRWLALLSVAGTAFAQISVVDDTGRTVALQSPARRIVTLAPHAAELVDAAGAGPAIVGVIKGSDYPAAVASLPVVGDANALDLERITMLNPDLIVTWPWTTPAQVGWLRTRGIAIFEADARTIGGIADDVDRIGTLTGTAAVASAASSALRGRIARLTVRTDAAPLRVFYQLSDQPLFTLGGHHLVSQALTVCGGQNVFAALTIPAPQVGLEAVLAANPQVIVAGTDAARRPAWLDDWLRWPALDAARDHALFVVDANLLHRPGPRFVDGVVELCDALATARRAVGRAAPAAPIIGSATARDANARSAAPAGDTSR